VTVSPTANAGPEFGGLTVQYSFMGSKKLAAAKSLTSQANSSKKGSAPSTTVKYYADEAKANFTVGEVLKNCDVYSSWRAHAEPDLASIIGANPVLKPDENQVKTVQLKIESEYQELLTEMLHSPSCQLAFKDFNDFLTTMLEAKTYDDFAAVQSSSAKPELALEYDLNTPQNKPSYSSAKLTGNWQFGRKTPGQPEVRSYAQKQLTTEAGATPGNLSDTAKQLAANAKPLALASAPPWSITATGTVDVYDEEPPSTVPSGSHLRDIQAGTEIDYQFAPFGTTTPLGKFIGKLTASAAYSYQDQTSPAILTGPALKGFTGLPTSTTSAYAQRGVIHLGQLRLGFGTGNNTTYPIAFTYSNRTELVVHPTWGLQFGVSYNFTSLLTGSSPTKSGSSSGSQ
jgi:hypothetical protein